MYIPPFTRIDDPEKARNFMEEHGFATLVTQKDGIPWASHLPTLVEKRSDGSLALRSHMAWANEQWTHFSSGQEVLCIFHGPHAYISPSWYSTRTAVPTWNYAVVHAYGCPEIVEDRAGTLEIVKDTARKYEENRPQPWTLDMPEAMLDGLLKGIVGFTIPVRRLETKFKLGQNRPREDQAGMREALANSACPGDRTLAAFMKNQREN